MTTTQHSETPSWTDYIIDTGNPECGTWLEESGMHLGGLRIMHLGAGRVALDDEAIERLQRLSDDSDGVIDQDEDGSLTMWIGGCTYPVQPAEAADARDGRLTPGEARAKEQATLGLDTADFDAKIDEVKAKLAELDGKKVDCPE